MKRYIWYIWPLVIGALLGAIYVAVKPRNVHSAKYLYIEKEPPGATQPFSRSLFSRRAQANVSRANLGVKAPQLWFRLLNDSGEPFTNQLALSVPARSSVDLFASVWNYTDQRQSLGLVQFRDSALDPLQIDGKQKTSMYSFVLEPNEYIDLPLTISLNERDARPQNLSFLLIRNPDQHADQNVVSAQLCCFAIFRTLWTDRSPAFQYAKNTPSHGALGFELLAPMRNSAMAAQAGQPIRIPFRLTYAAQWRLLALVDNQAVSVQTEQMATEDKDQWMAILPPLSAGKHDVILLYVHDSVAPTFDRAGTINPLFNHHEIRFTVNTQ